MIQNILIMKIGQPRNKIYFFSAMVMLYSYKMSIYKKKRDFRPFLVVIFIKVLFFPCTHVKHGTEEILELKSSVKQLFTQL
jgi:hypothetical protein